MWTSINSSPIVALLDVFKTFWIPRIDVYYCDRLIFNIKEDAAQIAGTVPHSLSLLLQSLHVYTRTCIFLHQT